MKRTSLIFAVASLAFLVVSAAPAQGRDKVHRGPNWSWTGPASWIGTYGTYGIRVESPSGRNFIDWGFSSTICQPGNNQRQSATRFMTIQRNNLRRAGVRFTNVGPVRLVGGSFFRQTNLYRVAGGGVRYRGQATFDYSFYDATYCNQSMRVMQAPARGFGSSFRQLNRIYHSMAYSGPGAIEPPRRR